MDPKKLQIAILSAATGVGAVVLAVILLRPAPTTPTPEPDRPTASVVTPKMAAQQVAPTPQVIDVVTEIDVSEFRYLPQSVAIPSRGSSPLIAMPSMISSGKRITNVRAITNKETQGEFLSPRWSPDGLQMIASRAGFEGLYVVDLQTGEARRIADGGAFNANWNPDGTIDVRGGDGTTRTYDADGTLIASRPTEQRTSPVHSEHDIIFASTPAGGRIPITGNDDRYYNPVVSPDGQHVVFEGLVTGLYIAPADGSGPPVYIGPGNNPQWKPDSSGVVFDVTADDGHHLTEGDIFLVDVGRTERTNLTPGDNLISQRPNLDPTGSRVAFEAEGVIYIGEVQ